MTKTLRCYEGFRFFIAHKVLGTNANRIDRMHGPGKNKNGMV